MRNSTYHYNPKTCQYERTRIRFSNVILYVIGLILTSAFLFVGLVVAYDRLTETKVEASLRKENGVYGNHKILLTNQLAEVETSLTKLNEKDNDLHYKIFGEAPSSAKHASLADNPEIVLARVADLGGFIDSLNTQLRSLHSRAKNRNTAFANIQFEKEDLGSLKSTPTMQPIANPNLNLLVSGFGIRINPFHKGNYNHPGIDFAAPYGTEVYATASGIISDINRSELQAGYGNFIEISHGNGFTTRYAHLDKINVKPGQRITKGALIGMVGNSGGSIAPHLHYEVIHSSKHVDPIGYMVEGLTSTDYNQLANLSKKLNQSLD